MNKPVIVIGYISELYRDNGKYNGNYYLGFRLVINEPLLFKGVNIRFPVISLIKGRGIH